MNDPVCCLIRSLSVDDPDHVQPSTSRALGKMASKDRSSEDEGNLEEDPSKPATAPVKGRSKSHSPTAQLPHTICFFSGNPLVETTEGIIHLYKDRYLCSSSLHLTDNLQVAFEIFSWGKNLNFLMVFAYTGRTSLEISQGY